MSTTATQATYKKDKLFTYNTVYIQNIGINTNLSLVGFPTRHIPVVSLIIFLFLAEFKETF